MTLGVLSLAAAVRAQVAGSTADIRPWSSVLVWGIVVPVMISVIGALITSVVVRGREMRRELTLKKIDQFLEFSRTEGTALDLLAGRGLLLTADQWKVIWETGDWFEVFALLLKHGGLDEDLVRDIGLDNNAVTFHHTYRERMQRLSNSELERAKQHFEGWRWLNDLAERS